MNARQQQIKRAFDLAVATPVLIALAPLIAVLAALARCDTGGSGIFRQIRIGRHGMPFKVLKLRTMRVNVERDSTITTRDDPRVTRFGAWLRRTKLDELPQLVNVVRGEMSLVGPRPDVPGWYDELTDEDRVLLEVRPGITSPATIAFIREEALLAKQSDPETYNREVLWPRKVALNRQWVQSWSFRQDLLCLWRTITGPTR